MEAFKLVDHQWLRIGAYDGSAKARIAPFEEVELEVGVLFPPRAQPLLKRSQASFSVNERGLMTRFPSRGGHPAQRSWRGA